MCQFILVVSVVFGSLGEWYSLCISLVQIHWVVFEKTAKNMRWGCCNKLEIQDGGRLGCSCISVDFLWDNAEAAV